MAAKKAGSSKAAKKGLKGEKKAGTYTTYISLLLAPLAADHALRTVPGWLPGQASEVAPGPAPSGMRSLVGRPEHH